MNYTKGEWKVIPMVQKEWDIEIKHYCIVGTINGIAERTVADVGEWKDRPNAEIDAHLISAAPELYEALKEALVELGELIEAAGAEEIEEAFGSKIKYDVQIRNKQLHEMIEEL